MRGDDLHEQTPEPERRTREAALDRTIEATFPASDPLSTLPNPDDDQALEPRRGPKSPGT